MIASLARRLGIIPLVCCFLVVFSGSPSPAQQPEPVQTAPGQAAAAPQHATAQLPSAGSRSAVTGSEASAFGASASGSASHSEITEEQLRQQLSGKTWYLRGMQLGDNLNFDRNGQMLDHATPGSYTLCLVRIEKVHLSHKRLELEGARYALHFLGALPYEDPQKSVEMIRITPKKKVLRITVARQEVVKPHKARKTRQPKTPAANAAALPDTTAKSDAKTADVKTTDGKTTDSPAVAAETLRRALDRILAPSLDDRMLASLPDDWQLYYAAQRSGRPFEPAGLLPASALHPRARLLKIMDPPSNPIAQANGIAGRALYRVVIEPSGKPGRIAIVRPIGFGLDENAVAAIRAASFQPAESAGHPAAEALDLAILFRIYSQRTSVLATGDKSKPAPAAANPSTPTGATLPGPYSVEKPQP